MNKDMKPTDNPFSGADNVLVVNKAVVTTSPSVIDDWTK